MPRCAHHHLSSFVPAEAPFNTHSPHSRAGSSYTLWPRAGASIDFGFGAGNVNPITSMSRKLSSQRSMESSFPGHLVPENYNNTSRADVFGVQVRSAGVMNDSCSSQQVPDGRPRSSSFFGTIPPVCKYPVLPQKVKFANSVFFDPGDGKQMEVIAQSQIPATRLRKSCEACKPDFEQCPLNWKRNRAKECVPPPDYKGFCNRPINFERIHEIEREETELFCDFCFPCMASEMDKF